MVISRKNSPNSGPFSKTFDKSPFQFGKPLPDSFKALVEEDSNSTPII